MQKEILTDEHIKNDMIKNIGITPDVSQTIAWLSLPVGLLVTLTVWLITRMNPLAWLIMLIPAALFVFLLYKNNEKKKNLSSGEFVVVTDRLTSITEDVPAFEYVSHRMANSSLRLFMHFDNNSSWMIPRRNYEWSSLYNMSDKGISNTSLNGDEFYIAVDKESGKIGCAYNMKLFDYRK